jgi:hypothetical protein
MKACKRSGDKLHTQIILILGTRQVHKFVFVTQEKIVGLGSADLLGS